MNSTTPNEIESPFYTAAEAAAYLRVNVATVHSLVKRGLLRCSAAIRHRRLLKEDVHSFFRRTCGGDGPK